MDEGYRINLPARTVRGDHSVAPLLNVSHPAVRVESVKLAEDRSGDLIVRLYESEGARASTDILFDVPGACGLRVVDLLERDVEAPAGTVLEQSSARLTLRPFQLLTLRLARKDGTARH